jgi:hypothetical protein
LSDKPQKLGIDVKAAAEEVKSRLDEKKFDLVDYSYANIDCWFEQEDYDSGKYPQMTKIRDQWEAMFNYAEEVTQDDGTGFPHEDVEAYEAELKEIERLVNTDKEYWEKIRAAVIPLYEKSPHYHMWQKRWKQVELFYDAVPMTVTVTKHMINKETGERKEGMSTVERERTIPAGVVIRVDKTKKKKDPVLTSGSKTN